VLAPFLCREFVLEHVAREIHDAVLDEVEYVADAFGAHQIPDDIDFLVIPVVFGDHDRYAAFFGRLPGLSGLGKGRRQGFFADIPATLIVVNNRLLALEKDKMLASGLAPLGVEVKAPDFSAYARVSGAKGFLSKTPPNLKTRCAGP